MLTLLGAAAFSMTSYADVDPSDVIKLGKQIIPVDSDNGKYKIRLETFVTGSSVTHQETVPVPIDLVLVLDVSSSMTNNNVPGDYKALTSKGYTYQGYGTNKYYYYDSTTNGYYLVTRQSYQPHYYRLYYDKGTTRYYLSGNSTTTTAPENVTTNQGTIWTGVLYKGGTHTAQQSKAYNYAGFPNNPNNNNKLYYKDGTNYYQVYRQDSPSANTYYTLSYTIGDTTYYLSGSGSTTIQPTNVTTQNATIWTGLLYSSTSITRLEALKKAVNAFIETVEANSKGKDGEFGTDDDVDNSISIVSFSRHEKYVTGTNDSTVHDNVADDADNDYSDNFIAIYDKENNKSNVDLLENYVTNLSTKSGTRQDRGLAAAINNLDAISADRFKVSNKVVVVFTDGEPYAGHEAVGGIGGLGSTNPQRQAVRNAAAKFSYTLKNGTRPDGLNYEATVFTVSTGLAENSVNDWFMKYLSSNYPTVNGTTGGDNTCNPVPADAQPIIGKKFAYNTESGADLTSIFTAIAKESSEGGTSYPLDAESTTLIDVVSNNFLIPSDVEKDDIKVWVEECWKADLATDGKTVTKYYWANLREGDDNYDPDHYHSEFVGTVPEPVITFADDTGDGKIPNSLSIKGFDFAKKDTPSIEGDDNSAPVPYSGNWVGPRTINGDTKYWGRRLVIEFPINVNPDYEGGYAMPSNDIQSGLYVNGTKILEYPVPTVDFPSICIMKDGLKVGESALFEVTGPKNLKYTVRLTQNGKDPCYVILKRLDGGLYTVKELDWSWMYSATDGTATEIAQDVIGADELGLKVEDFLIDGSGATEISLDGVTVGLKINHTATVDGKTHTGTFCILKDKEGNYTVDELKGCAISLLYHFSNTRITTDKPARAEAYAHNEFKGGKTTGGTEYGGNEEEDI